MLESIDIYSWQFAVITLVLLFGGYILFITWGYKFFALPALGTFGLFLYVQDAADNALLTLTDPFMVGAVSAIPIIFFAIGIIMAVTGREGYQKYKRGKD